MGQLSVARIRVKNACNPENVTDAERLYIIGDYTYSLHLPLSFSSSLKLSSKRHVCVLNVCTELSQVCRHFGCLCFPNIDATNDTSHHIWSIGYFSKSGGKCLANQISEENSCSLHVQTECVIFHHGGIRSWEFR